MQELFPDAYSLNARWFPSVLVSLPSGALIATLAINYIHLPGYELIRDMASIVVSLSFAAGAAIKFLSGMIRDKGKQLEENVFKNRAALPTTEFLLWGNNEFSIEYKSAIRAAIKTDFGRSLLDVDDEEKDDMKARKLIAEAVDLIRPRVNGGVRLLQYNIRYGFARNLAAGSRNVGLPSAFVCMFLAMCWLDNRACVVVEAILMLFYLFQILTTSKNIRWYGEEYARVLFAEYMERRTVEKKAGIE